MKTSEAAARRAQGVNAGMYGDEGDNPFADAKEEKPPKVAIQPTASLNPTLTGIQITGQVNEKEWEALAESIAQAGNSVNWLLGDMCLIGSHHEYGAYTRFAEKHNIEQRRLDDLIYVCRNVTYTVRTVGLSFTHHRLVATFYDPDNPLESRETQKKLLTYAAVNDFSVAKFREYLNALPTTTDERGQVAIVPANASTITPAPPEIPVWEKPIDRLEDVFTKRWQSMNPDNRAAAIKRLEDLLKMLKRLK